MNDVIQEVVDVWKEYVKQMPNWETLIEGVVPKDTTCGPIYELQSPLSERTEMCGQLRNRALHY